MQIGLIGFPQVGKRTLFRLLTGVDTAATPPNGPVIGISPVRDARVDRLAALYHPQKTTPATIQYLLLPDMTQDSTSNQQLFKAIEKVDAIAHVVRAFSDDSVFHLEGSVDPLRDIARMHAELILNDLLFVEKRLERLQKELARTNDEAKKKEQALMERCRAHLEQELPLRGLACSPEEQRALANYPFLTRKAVLIVLNVGEDAIGDTALIERVRDRFKGQGVGVAPPPACGSRSEPLPQAAPPVGGHAGGGVVQVSAKIEEELAQLDDADERAAFLKELGIRESALDQLTRVSHQTLGLIVYFTVGEDEVRAWTIRRGASAPEAGGAIHSDITRGFIRAELIKFDDLLALGSEAAVQRVGKAQLKGKDYVVEDGDILNFRFSV